ncbi:MAG: pilus assembly protein PilM [Bacillota bacterium]|nr:pilus assembly protein PilM [Bacillota bacterium]
MAKQLSIDIGSKKIKIIEGKNERTGLRIDKAVTEATPYQAAHEGNIDNYDDIKNILVKSIKSNNFKSKNVVFNISTTSLITRSLELPVVKGREDTVQMIKYELEQYMPVVLSDYKIVYRIIDTFEKEGLKKANYLVYAVPNSLIEDYIKLAKDLKLRLNSINLSFNSIESIFKPNREISGVKIEKDKAYYVIELGHKMIVFNVMKNGKNIFSRIINQGGDDIDLGIVNLFEIDKENAIASKHKLSNLDDSDVYTEEEKFINNIVRTNVNAWITEIRKLIQFFNSKNKDDEIGHMFLYGGSSNIKNIEAYFDASFNLETKIIDDVKNIKLNDKNINKGYFRISEYLDSVAGLYQRKEDINLLADLIEYKRNRIKKVAGSTLLVGVIAAALVFYFVSVTYKINALEDDIAQADSILENEVYQQKLQELEELKTRISVLQEYRDNLGILNQGINNMDFVDVYVLNTLADNIPIDIEMSNLNVTNTNITFNATSSSRPSVAQLERNLKDIDFITDVHIPGITKSTEGEVETFSFSVNCTVDGGYSNEN